MAIAAPGKEFRRLEAMRSYTTDLDILIDKPLRFQKLKAIIERHLARRRMIENQGESAQIRKLLPNTLKRSMVGAINSGDVVLSEKTILVTDIRRSTEIISQEKLNEYFARLNQHFTRLGEEIEKFGGEVIKYTGDGMIAVFDGFGRRQLALKCAVSITNVEKHLDSPFDIGIGIHDGLVMTGFIGSSSRLFYDVIGKNVHIACRLCEQARTYRTLVSETIMKESKGAGFEFLPLTLDLPGLPEPTTCYALKT